MEHSFQFRSKVTATFLETGSKRKEKKRVSERGGKKRERDKKREGGKERQRQRQREREREREKDSKREKICREIEREMYTYICREMD